MLKKFSLLLVAALLLGTSLAPTYARSYRTKSSDVYVKAYTTKSGTHKSAYYRTPKDSTKTNNYSCIDNGKC